MYSLNEIPYQYAFSILIILILYFTRKRLPSLPKEKEKRVRKWALNYSLDVGNPLRTVLLPFVIMFLLSGLYPPSGEPLLNLAVALYILPVMVIIQPLAEELFLRGIVFGGFLNVAEGKQKSRLVYASVIVSGLLVQSVIFMIMHLSVNVITFLNGIVYALIFFYWRNGGRRNILPAWAAHSTHNLLVWLAQVGLFGFGWIYLV